MKLSYTRRLMLSVSAYTFILIASIFFIVWFVIEQIELDEERRLPEQLGIVIDRMLSPASDVFSVDLPEGIKLYLPKSKTSTIYSRYKKPGVYEIGDGNSLLVRLHPTTKNPYYLVYAEPNMINEITKDRYELGITLLGVISATIAVIVFITILVKRLASPVLQLKEYVDKYDGESSEFPLLKRDDEVGALSRSFNDLIMRMRSFAQRERDFTRFASHELRSPVTVIRGNIDLLAETVPATNLNQIVLSRIQTASQRMTQLIDTFLCLGRAELKKSPTAMDAKGLQSLIGELLNTYPESERKRIRIDSGQIQWQVDRFLLSILLDNLIRNSFRHGQEEVLIVAEDSSLQVSNCISSGDKTDNTGIGLDIVSRLCEVNGWLQKITRNQGRFTVDITIESKKLAVLKEYRQGSI